MKILRGALGDVSARARGAGWARAAAGGEPGARRQVRWGVERAPAAVRPARERGEQALATGHAIWRAVRGVDSHLLD
jgi:hypothetical protein